MAYSLKLVAAVMVDLINGMSQREAAKKHGVSHTSVQNWAVNLPDIAVKKDIGELVEEHLRRELRTLDTIASYAEDKEFFGKHAADIAIFYGVMSDKAHAKLAALERAQREFQQRQERQQLEDAKEGEE